MTTFRVQSMRGAEPCLLSVGLRILAKLAVYVVVDARTSSDQAL
jgi:hypothetical protein